MKHEKDIIQEYIDEYNSILKDKALKSKEIEQVKDKLNELKVQYNTLEDKGKRAENVLQAEVYKYYSKKDLLILGEVIEKLAKKEVIADFKTIRMNFDNHNLGVNDITQLQTYIKLYGPYVNQSNNFIKTLFKAFGGKQNG